MIASLGGQTEIVRYLLAHPEIDVNIQKYVVEPRVQIAFFFLRIVLQSQLMFCALFAGAW